MSYQDGFVLSVYTNKNPNPVKEVNKNGRRTCFIEENSNLKFTLTNKNSCDFKYDFTIVGVENGKDAGTAGFRGTLKRNSTETLNCKDSLSREQVKVVKVIIFDNECPVTTFIINLECDYHQNKFFEQNTNPSLAVVATANSNLAVSSLSTPQNDYNTSSVTINHAPNYNTGFATFNHTPNITVGCVEGKPLYSFKHYEHSFKESEDIDLMKNSSGPDWNSQEWEVVLEDGKVISVLLNDVEFVTVKNSKIAITENGLSIKGKGIDTLITNYKFKSP